MVNPPGRKSLFSNSSSISAAKPLFTLFSIIVLTAIYYEYYLSIKLNEISTLKAYLNRKENQNENIYGKEYQSANLTQLREEYENKKIFADNIENQVARDDYMKAILNIFNNKPKTSRLHLIKVNTSGNQAPIPPFTRNRAGDMFKSEIISISFVSNYEESFQTIANIMKLPFAISMQSLDISDESEIDTGAGISTDELILKTNIELRAFHK